MKGTSPDIVHVEPSVSKLLSICITGRDDDYMLDFKYRITTTINYIARNLKQLERLDDLEILITDWGSEVPLAYSLPLSSEARHLCRFIYVPPEVVHLVTDGKDSFHTVIAVNAGLRRASGKFIMLFAADTLIPQHSLESILFLLSGKLNLPINVDRTYFLLRRYQVPWQFVQRQPSLEEWDRYLLLNTSELKDETAARLPKLLSVSSGVGALMSHRSVWHEVRGLDEALAGWGENDVDVGLRITQCHPWVELSNIGVSLFHMEHPPHGGRYIIIKQKRNPRVYNPIPQVNGENWGLGSYKLKIQTSQNTCASDEIVKSLALRLKSESQKIESWEQTRQEVLSELTSREVRDHVRRIIELFLGGQRDWGDPRDWNVDLEDIVCLCFLSWYSRYHYPRRYLEFGVRQSYAAAVVAAGCPSVEIYGIDNWEGMAPRHAPVDVAQNLRRRVAHQGYIRFVNGNINTAIQRLRASFVGSFFLDLVLVQGDLLGDNAVEQVLDILRHLAAGGALVLSCQSTDRFASLWNEIKRWSPQFMYLQCKDRSTGLILAASLKSDHKNTMEESCVFETRWIWLSLLKCQSLRLYHALMEPTSYPKYMSRVYHWVRRRMLFVKR